MSKQSKAEQILDSTWLPALLMMAVAIVVAFFFRRRQQAELSQGSDEPVIWRRDIEMGPVTTSQEQDAAQSRAGAKEASTRSPEMGPDAAEAEETGRARVIGPVERENQPESETPAGDDLEIIEGIGPKINTILQEAGIRTFRKLAETDVERLRQILRDAGLRTALSNPETWSEQAQLAADGEWNKLETLQDSLKAGRRG